MAPKTPLTRDQIAEVMLLHKRGWTPADIAPKFDRSPGAIERVLDGRTYRGVTGRVHVRTEGCTCRRCSITRREDRNLDAIEDATWLVQCAKCGGETVRRVVIVQRLHGRVMCDSCDGRKQ